MIRAFYSGTTGMRTQQTAVDTIANNIANLNTTGYDAQTARFGDLLHTSMLEPADAAYASVRAGSGAGVSSVRTDVSSGGEQETDRALDYCPAGNGFFAVEGTDGVVRYTRNGAFSIDIAGGAHLTDAQGESVLDAAGNPIAVDADGKPAAEPGVFTFPAASQLEAQGDSRYMLTASSGAAQVSNEGVNTGRLASSNVELGDEMSRLILSQRGYQLSSRVVQTADQIAELTNNL